MIDPIETMRLDALSKLDRQRRDAQDKEAWLAVMTYMVSENLLNASRICVCCDSGKLFGMCTCPEARETFAKSVVMLDEKGYFDNIPSLNEPRASRYVRYAKKTLKAFEVAN